MMVRSPFWKDEIMESVWQNWIKKNHAHISLQSNCPFWLSPSVIFVVLKIFPREPMKNGCQQNHPVSWSDLERQGHRVNLCPTSRGRVSEVSVLSFRHQTQVQVWRGFPKKKHRFVGNVSWDAFLLHEIWQTGQEEVTRRGERWGQSDLYLKRFFPKKSGLISSFKNG